MIQAADKQAKAAVGYVRVSTSDQATAGVSLDAQKAKIEAWATLQGLELHAIHEDAGISGKSAVNRPALQAALQQACKEQAVLVVYSLSRLARSTKDAISISERLDKAKADLASITECIDTTTAAGRMVFKMLAVLAEFERETLSERTQLAMGFKRKQSQRISRRIPFGWSLSGDGVSLVANADEQKIVETLLRWRKAGMSYGRICQALHKRKVPNKSGVVRWYPSVVRGIVERLQS